MQMSKELMDAFYERSRGSLAVGDYEQAHIWGSCESMVNNLHHGIAPVIWLSKLKIIMEDWKQKETAVESVAAYDEALELVEIALLIAAPAVDASA